MNQTIDFIHKDLVHKVVVACRCCSQLVHIIQRFLNPCRFIDKRNDGTICRFSRKVGIVQRISRIGTGKSCCIRTVLFNGRTHNQKVSTRFGHLFSIHQDMSIGIVASWPQVWFVFPNGSVIKQGHGQMVGNQIFGTHTQIHGIPIPEFLSHTIERFLCNGRRRRKRSVLVKHIIKDISCQILWINVGRTLGNISIQIIWSTL
mmetsp:Transcript_25936/g.37967  ORF Transcript_25936/g.37967 Transcript_25936/m.37967 type:complete len:203 (-) Transcript_25936:863-1471(-)